MAVNSLLQNLRPSGVATLFHRPRLLALLISLIVIGWFGWQSYQLAFDQPLLPVKISAHQLRLNTGQLTKLQAAIAAYQAPLDPVAVPTDLLAPAPSGS